MSSVYLIGRNSGFRNDPMNKVVSNLPGVHDHLGDVASRAQRRGATQLAMHRHEGHAKVTTTEGDVDWFVNLDDEAGERAAAAIEFGYSRNGKIVRGLYILTRATGLA